MAEGGHASAAATFGISDAGSSASDQTVEAATYLGSHVFVGREAELQSLRDALHAAVAGRGQLRLLIGEPGIGKTRTAHELASYAAVRGAKVLWGRCSKEDGAPTFWPWVQVLRAAMRDLDDASLRTVLGMGGSAIAAIVPELRQRLPDQPPAVGFDAPRARFRLFDAVTRCFDNLARRTPVLLIFDDLHQAGQPSLLLAQFLTREIGDLPLLLLGTCSDGAFRSTHPLAATLGDLLRQPHAGRLVLGGLSETEVERLLSASANVKPAAALVAAVHRRTEGNPLFVGEYVRLVLSRTDAAILSDPLAPVDFPIPESVKVIIGRRLDTLSVNCHQLLRAAAVIGREFSLDVLEAVVGFSQAGNGLDTEAALRDAVTADVLVPVSDLRKRYAFSHRLIRDTLDRELSTGERRQLHRTLVAILEAHHVSDPQAHARAIAHHALAAAQAGAQLGRVDDGDADKAVRHVTAAAAQAAAMLGYEEAAGLYQHALAALDLRRSPDERSRCELLLALAEAQTRAVDATGAKDNFHRAATLARRLGTVELLARAALGTAAVGTGLPFGQVDDSLVGLLEEALVQLPPDDSALRVRLLARLAIELQYADEPERRALLTEEALDIAHRLGEVSALAFALHARHYVLWEPGHAEVRLTLANAMVRLAERVGEHELLLQGRIWRTIDLLQLGDAAVLDREIHACAALAERLQQPRYRWMATYFRAVRALSCGEFAEAERLNEEALAHGQRAQDPGAINFSSTLIYALRGKQGRLGDFEATMRFHLEQYPLIPGARIGLARVYSELGRVDEARAEFERLAANDFADIPLDYAWLPSIAYLAEVCGFLGDATRAATLYELLRPCAAQHFVIGHPATFYDGPIAYYLGILAATGQNWEAADAHFADSLVRSARMGARPHVALTQYQYARMLLAAGDPPARAHALQLATDALAAAEELGMQGLAEKARALRGQLSALGDQHLFLPGPPEAARPERSRRGRGEDQTAAGETMFRREGDYWVVAYGGTVLRLKDGKGLRYLAQLLRHPGREFLALDLVMQASAPTSDEPAARGGSAAAGEALLDAPAKAAYRRRLAELREELEEAERFNDLGRAARARQEMDLIGQQLAAAIGLGGRDRRSASDAERARQTVTKGIKAVIAKMAADNPALGRHLSAAVATGYFCAYRPDPEAPVAWAF